MPARWRREFRRQIRPLLRDVNPEAARGLAERCGIGGAGSASEISVGSEDRRGTDLLVHGHARRSVVEAAAAAQAFSAKKPIDHTLAKIDRALAAVAAAGEAAGGVQPPFDANFARAVRRWRRAKSGRRT
ncbi:MAG: hypothetical protein IPM24_20025 [Bryobacterales bacterium]|nr:hypothetical protein [Bryobacterales bacterium]